MLQLQKSLDAKQVYIIAEMSANHAGKLENALELVRVAKQAGADCLKIQTYTADTLTLDCDNEYFRIKGGLWDGYKLHDLYKDAYTPWEWQGEIKAECERVGIDFLSTPFDRTSVDFLENLGIAFYKIASFELVDIPLIEYVASKGKPMIISCGMGSIEEIQEALDACHRMDNDQVILLKCCSEYPANYDDMHLANIPDMQERFAVPIGLSDHSMGSLAAVVGVSLGACVVEKHFCLSRAIKNPDSEFSMEPEEFASMVRDIRDASRIRGSVSYSLTEKEQSSTVFRRSIFCSKDIRKGELFTAENVRCVRPGYGMKPKCFKGLIGRKATAAIAFGEPIQKEMIDSPFEEHPPKSADFESDRLLFREICAADAKQIVKWRSTPAIYRYFRNPKPLTLENHLAWFANTYQNDPTRIEFLIIEKESMLPIGMVGMSNWNEGTSSGEVGYTIGEASGQGKGYASEAVSSIIHEFSRKGLSVCVATIHQDNAASRKVVEKNGFSLVETLDDGFLMYQKELLP